MPCLLPECLDAAEAERACSTYANVRFDAHHNRAPLRTSHSLAPSPVSYRGARHPRRSKSQARKCSPSATNSSAIASSGPHKRQGRRWLTGLAARPSQWQSGSHPRPRYIQDRRARSPSWPRRHKHSHQSSAPTFCHRRRQVVASHEAPHSLNQATPPGRGSSSGASLRPRPPLHVPPRVPRPCSHHVDLSHFMTIPFRLIPFRKGQLLLKHPAPTRPTTRSLS